MRWQPARQKHESGNKLGRAVYARWLDFHCVSDEFEFNGDPHFYCELQFCDQMDSPFIHARSRHFRLSIIERLLLLSNECERNDANRKSMSFASTPNLWCMSLPVDDYFWQKQPYLHDNPEIASKQEITK